MMNKLQHIKIKLNNYIKKEFDKFDSFIKSGTVMQNYANVLELLLRLRQACDHPFLVCNAIRKSQSGNMNNLDQILKKMTAASNASEFFAQVTEKNKRWRFT